MKKFLTKSLTLALTLCIATLHVPAHAITSAQTGALAKIYRSINKMKPETIDIVSEITEASKITSKLAPNDLKSDRNVTNITTKLQSAAKAQKLNVTIELSDPQMATKVKNAIKAKKPKKIAKTEVLSSEEEEKVVVVTQEEEEELLAQAKKEEEVAAEKEVVAAQVEKKEEKEKKEKQTTLLAELTRDISKLNKKVANLSNVNPGNKKEIEKAQEETKGFEETRVNLSKKLEKLSDTNQKALLAKSLDDIKKMINEINTTLQGNLKVLLKTDLSLEADIKGLEEQIEGLEKRYQAKKKTDLSTMMNISALNTFKQQIEENQEEADKLINTCKTLGQEAVDKKDTYTEDITNLKTKAETINNNLKNLAKQIDEKIATNIKTSIIEKLKSLTPATAMASIENQESAKKLLSPTDRVNNELKQLLDLDAYKNAIAQKTFSEKDIKETLQELVTAKLRRQYGEATRYKLALINAIENDSNRQTEINTYHDLGLDKRKEQAAEADIYGQTLDAMIKDFVALSKPTDDEIYTWAAEILQEFIKIKNEKSITYPSQNQNNSQIKADIKMILNKQ